MRNIFAIIFCIFETCSEIIEPGIGNRDRFSWVQIQVEALWEGCHSWELTAGDQSVIHFTNDDLSIYLYITFKLLIGLESSIAIYHNILLIRYTEPDWSIYLL